MLGALLAPEGVADYLSGLLLGARDRRSAWLGATTGDGEAAMTLVGDSALCERYRRAFARAGFNTSPGAAGAAARRRWRIARHAGMLAA